MSRLLPQPLVSLALLSAWLLAHNSIAPGTALLGAVLAVVLPLWTARFWPEYPKRVRYGKLLRLLAVVSFDIVIANVRIAILILGPRRRIHPRFIAVPLVLTSPFSITLLASIISLTPGTVSSNLSGDRRTLLVHGLAVHDADEAVRHIRRRYEQPLLEIFGC
jgi:multicomponent K+:H+ antiporter subunit E